jgi:hypothetical protein
MVSLVKIANIYEMGKEENKWGVFGSTPEKTSALNQSKLASLRS